MITDRNTGMHWPSYSNHLFAENNSRLDATSTVMVNTPKSVNASGVTWSSWSCGPDTIDKPAMTTTCRLRNGLSRKTPHATHDPSRKRVAVMLEEERSKNCHTKEEEASSKGAYSRLRPEGRTATDPSQAYPTNSTFAHGHSRCVAV